MYIPYHNRKYVFYVTVLLLKMSLITKKQNIPMKFKTLFLCLSVFFITASVNGQAVYERLIYSHPLTDGSAVAGETITRTGGTFLPDSGWKADTETSQLIINLSQTLPFEGMFVIDVTNFDPVSQNVADKQQIINLYSRLYSNNKDIFYTVGSWWNVRTGIGYSDGPGVAGFKFLSAPKGLDTREEIRCIQSATWDLTRTYEFKIIWNQTNIYCYLDDIELANLNFNGQVEPFKYILIGRDNIDIYRGQPGVVYSNLRIYGPELPPEDITPPVVSNIGNIQNNKIRLFFSENIDNVSAENVNNYVINPAISVLSSTLLEDSRTVELLVSGFSDNNDYSISISNVADKSENANKIDTTFVYHHPPVFHVADISRTGYYLKSVTYGDSVYIDRGYVFTELPGILNSYKYLITANGDKLQSDPEFLTFNVNTEASVIVAYDSTSAQIPSWLAQWQKLSLIVKSDDTVYECYTKSVSPFEVVLGGNSSGTSSSMYLVFIAQKDENPPASPTGLQVSRF